MQSTPFEMSFEALPSDIIDVTNFCKALYRKCGDAGGEYDEISDEVKGLHTVLRHLKYEIEDPESLLNRDRPEWGGQLDLIICDCDATLRQLDDLLQKYGRLNSNRKESRSSKSEIRRFNSIELDQLGTIRVQLVSHQTGFTQFLDILQLQQSNNATIVLDNEEGQLNIILDKVDAIAARMGHKSSKTNSIDSNDIGWNQFQKELVAAGFSDTILQQHKDVLRAYIREIDQKGLLDEAPTVVEQHSPVNGVRANHGESGQPKSSGNPQFYVDNLKTTTNPLGVKEMMFREDDMKFPLSMKVGRMRPETPRNLAACQKCEVTVPPPIQSKINARNNSSQTPTLKLPDRENQQFLNASGSSDSDSDTSQQPKISRSPSAGQIIRTSDLLASTQAVQLLPQGSPRSFDSHRSAYESEGRSSVEKVTEYQGSGSSLRSNAIPIHTTNWRSWNDQSGTSPRPSEGLAPDSYGNEIASDANWTKISRHIVTPEVFKQDGRSRPEFVAILGVLSREEIREYSARSHALRAARTHRARPLKPTLQATNQRNRQQASSSEDEQSSDSGHRCGEHHSREHRSAVAPKSKNWKTDRDSFSVRSPPKQTFQDGIRTPATPQKGQGHVHYHPSEREKEHSRRNHRNSSKHSSHSRPRNYSDRDSGKSSLEARRGPEA
ncbi:hypothetical protein G7Y89_g2745 [Cudoniella acicularis]|uniref:DUF8035 domain-containing protein n=1 Tax=Cudoniella acicularis TaxID=354080 RepID=A0A8H4RSS0_9HELO|nr:hypothetical protein G7Y89_g2745 [Cudoniella acicularis]